MLRARERAAEDDDLARSGVAKQVAMATEAARLIGRSWGVTARSGRRCRASPTGPTYAPLTTAGPWSGCVRSRKDTRGERLAQDRAHADGVSSGPAAAMAQVAVTNSRISWGPIAASD